MLRSGQSNALSFEDFDHAVEASLLLSSGVIQVLNCPDSSIELEVEVQPGVYRVRIYSSNLSSVDGDAGEDVYLIEMWPDEHPYKQKERRVFKKYLG